MIMIRGVDMPTCCADCFAYVGEGDFPYCRILESDYRAYTFDIRQNRMPSCPMKEQEPRVMTLEDIETLDDVCKSCQEFTCDDCKIWDEKHRMAYDD